ncbi:hypothetical protein JI435_163380, partial [Parastagonospora nodorum SN15]
ARCLHYCDGSVGKLTMPYQKPLNASRQTGDYHESFSASLGSMVKWRSRGLTSNAVSVADFIMGPRYEAWSGNDAITQDAQESGQPSPCRISPARPTPETRPGGKSFLPSSTWMDLRTSSPAISTSPSAYSSLSAAPPRTASSELMASVDNDFARS